MKSSYLVDYLEIKSYDQYSRHDYRDYHQEKVKADPRLSRKSFIFRIQLPRKGYI